MKKIIAMWMILIILLTSALPAAAAEGKVTYSGNAGNFIFEPGSEYSPTDLFADFKDVMPGDHITQKITVKNKADNKVKVKIYMRSLGAQEESAEFLSQLGLKVAKSEGNKMAQMFDAAADEAAQLTDWVCLGTLYSGGIVDLDVTLEVPAELPNEFQKAVGYLDWEFKIEEFPIESSDPQSPDTGDDFRMELWLALMLGSAVLILILLLWRRREKKE